MQNGRSLKSTTTANASDFTSEMIKAADCGIKLAFNLCHSIASHEDTKEAITRYAPSALLLSAPYIDGFGQSFDDHLPISSSIYGELARMCVRSLPDCDFICLDGVYESFDRAYTDLATLRTGTDEK